MEREHLLSAVLADETRFSIYRFIAERPCEEFAVVDIARRFGLHPNVARMHLTKLEQAGFLATGIRRSALGGRPARLYRLAGMVNTFAFPPRRYELLAELALDIVAAAAAPDAVARICREAGWRDGGKYVAEHGGRPRGIARLAAAVRAVAEAQGLLPNVVVEEDELNVEVRNCVFREPGGRQPELACLIHRSYLAGLIDALGGAATRAVEAQGSSIRAGADRCRLVCALERPAGREDAARA
ncbi:MAG: helix-turn-helix domain-containing protein [Actinobacteria bacterium]|nr:helix-turn-helix domain-containing protein [Actinomycetota bacterium]